VLLNKMNTTVDGEFQRYAVEDGAYIREHFFGPDPRLRQLVEHLSDDELRWLPRGGHDYRKLYAAYTGPPPNSTGKPTVILAKTIKGWTLGSAEVEGRNATHQIKKMTNEQQLRAARPPAPRVRDPRGGAGRRGRAAVLPPAEGSPEHDYLMARRRALGGSLPSRRSHHAAR
jgi:pyruvate dehydrogenase E1 component